LTAIKFCGITRPEDALLAAELGATYVGMVFAGGPRNLDPTAARVIAATLEGTGVRRVAVLDASHPDSLLKVADLARSLPVEVLQLHGSFDPALIELVRSRTELEVWAAIGVVPSELPAAIERMAATADAILLDAKTHGKLGGSGRRFDWEVVAAVLEQGARPRRLVVAGGLDPDNVGAAIGLLRPDVVDVSSGVEQSPGIKDGERMKKFVAAVHRAGCGSGR
jgi:phosphoribosylanthranilate isomerase